MRLSPRRSNCFPLHSNLAAELQLLEPRTLPAGTVTASISGQNVTIDGDNFPNSIRISVRTDGVYLMGLLASDENSDTNIRFAGVTTSSGKEIRLVKTPRLGDLTILMRGGNDSVRIDVGVAAGDKPAAVIAGRLQINLGSGNDNAALVLNNGTLKITGNLEGDLENGNDGLLVGTTQLLSDPDAEIPKTIPITVGGNVMILGRSGVDLIGLAGINVTQSAILQGGDHRDSLTLTGVTLGGNLSLSGEGGDDDVVLKAVKVAGTTTVLGGRGNDQVVITSLNATKNVSVLLESGDDQLAVGALTLTKMTKVTLVGGGGFDELMLESELTNPPVKVLGFEDIAATIDAKTILAEANDRVAECLIVTLPLI